MFADIKEIHPGAALALQSKLRQAAAAVKQPQYSSPNPSRPPQVHLLPSYSAQINFSGDRTSSGAPRATSATGARTDITNIGLAALTGAPITQPPRYVLLCVNARRLRILEHVDVTTITTDEALFDLLREKYSLTREPHKWKLPLLRWTVPIGRYLFGYRVDVSILSPKSADYVRVG